MSATSKPRYVVQCGDWTTPSFSSRAVAEHQKAQIEQAGHCQNEHKVVQVDA